ncbi:MATE family efflux transporter [Aurantibacillus circumpalustris]|uniref:MATE family efflux transporter n=1 Tax=Aurantibacillus circumpalustris TaxID=3036359 RepID=UPI00295BA26F|nr:MATE family efflux transporter [Aurantibacillus circumpalustris]
MPRNFFKNYHIRDTIHLAWPLVATQVGHILTGMVDNIFLGRLGSTEQAAGILSNNLFMLLMVFAIGFSYATTPLTTSAHEKNDLYRKASLFKNSLFLNFTVALVCFIFWFLGSGLLNYMKQPQEVVVMAVPYFNVIIFSILPVSLFFACKQYCEGLSNTRMALIISLTGNAINVVLNYLLIYGEFGFPELGYMGAAWASFYARLFMGAAFVILIFRSPVTRSINKVYTKVKVNWKDLADLWKIGFNTAMQFTFEVAAFVIAGLMAGAFGKEQIDAHGIALNIAAFTYMFASGISSAVTIRVGIYKAKGNWSEIKSASNAAFKLVLWVMGFFGASFIVFNKFLPMAFSTENNIIEMASGLLIIAAMFQLFDGMQVTIIGILRGLEDVRIPTLVTLIGYWIIALPLAYFLAFTLKMEITGIWIALLASLFSVALGLYWRLNYLIKHNLAK